MCSQMAGIASTAVRNGLAVISSLHAFWILLAQSGFWRCVLYVAGTAFFECDVFLCACVCGLFFVAGTMNYVIYISLAGAAF